MSEHLANTIKEIRVIHGLTQEKLAEIVDKSPAHIGMIEQGKSKPSYEVMEKMIKDLGLEANMFFESTKGNRQLAVAEISRLLEGLSGKQTHSLVQLFRFGIEIIKANEDDANSDM